MFPVGPQPFESAPGDVILAGIPLVFVRDPQTGEYDYQVNDPERFADKISTGDLRYGDFNPYENPFAMGQFDGGYGLRRFDDLNNPQTEGTGVVKETSNVDCRFGPAFLAPLLTAETLPGATGPAVWLGEFTPSTGTVTGARWVAVYPATGGGRIAYRNVDGTWTNSGVTLLATPQKGAVAIANGQLLIGYGAARAAQYVTALDGTSLADVTNTTPTSLFAFAMAVDRAALYLAGGTAATNVNTVLSASLTAASPATSFGLAATAVTCGSADSAITALAPGGGIALLFVAKTRELGELAEVTVAGGTSPSVIYRVLVPFDLSLSSNGQGMKWWMGRGGDEQRGPTILVLPRDRDPWVYSPSSQDSGQASNIAPWARHGYRPPNIRGKPTAFQGTARYLYYAITSTGGRSWVLCREGQTQVAHGAPTYALFDLGAVASETLGLTSLFGTNPLFFSGSGNNLVSAIFPTDGSSPLDDPACRFAASGTLDIPDISHGFPDEDKVEFSIRMVHDGVVPGGQDITVWASIDGGAYTKLGTAGSGNASSVAFATTTVCKRVAPRFVLSTTDPSKTPVLLAFSVRASINPLLYREWVFVAEPALHQMPWGGDDLQNPYQIVQTFWNARRNGVPMAFTDDWGDNYVVRLLRFNEQHRKKERGRPPEVRCTFRLLWVSDGTGNVTYGAAFATYGSIISRYGASGVGSSVMYDSTTATYGAPSSLYR